MVISRSGMAVMMGAAAILFTQQGIDLLIPATARQNSLVWYIRSSDPAFAIPKYIPRSGGKAPRRTQGTGSRTGGLSNQCSATPFFLSILVPQERVGLTTSGHPTFSWYLSGAITAPIEFTLVKPGDPQPVFVQQIAAPQPGITELSLPKELPELAAGTQYRWTVNVICNPQRRSEDIFVQALIERTEVPETLSEQLATATEDTQRASVYIQAGLWYDAMQALSAAQAANPQDQSILKERLALLEQVGLDEVVKQESGRLDSSQNSPQ